MTGILNGIVHTAEFFMYFYPLEIEYIEEIYGGSVIYKDAKKFTLEMNNIKITIIKSNIYGYTGMKIDFIKLLNKPNLGSSDLNEIYKKIYTVLEPMCRDSKFPILKRWDFRLDVKFNDTYEKDLIYKLYDKTTTKLYGLNRTKFINDSICNNNYNYYYKTNAINSSITLNLYDKQNERFDKEIEPKAYEKNVIRYEVQLRKRHIDYNNYKKAYKREIDSYLDEDLFMFYMEKYIKPIVYFSDYYDIYSAKKIINAGVTRKDERKKLINFLTLVSRNNIDKAKEIYTTHVFKHCINVLDKLGINPVLIPKHYNIKKIVNPLSTIYTLYGK
ncbi:hypothetical protein [Clostridium tagluense]|uniref:hypothetical protein n=1 Tax=Clostridium tagluense TaxID=360422 RepID=UPI001CF10CFE|nr:hypothetical protein [Clostridium tagluense]MCB2298887.1 hypothetical protein [Clostridium tagluense]